MSNSIPSTPRPKSQSETDTETSSLVSSPSASEKNSASEDGSEKSAQPPVMKTRQPSDAAPPTPAAHNANSSAPPQAAMTSSAPTVKNRQTGDQKRARYRQARNLPAYQRDTNIKKVKIEKQGGAADMQQAPKPDGRWDQFTKAVTTDGKLELEILDLHVMSELVAWLRTSPSSLRELRFYNNFGYDRAPVIALADALRGNTTLIKLAFVGYAICDDGATAIADVLKVNITLTELNLFGNNIGDKGALALADALKVNKTLTRLDLDCNFISDEGAKLIADALKINNTLTELDLSVNWHSDEGAKALLEALRVNETLIKFLFKANDKEIGIEVSNLLERNRLQPYAKAGLGLLVRHSPALKGMDALTDVIPLIAQHFPKEILATFEQGLKDGFRAPPPPITTTTTNTTTTTTTTTTDATIFSILNALPPAFTTVPVPPPGFVQTATAADINARLAALPPAFTTVLVPPPGFVRTATAADINALLDDPNPVAALSRWIDGHANPAAALNWVDPSNGYTLLHYAVEAQQGAVVRSLLARPIDRTRADHNNQTAAQLAQQRADSSSSSAVAAIAALFK
jgi:hypothetical protein